MTREEAIAEAHEALVYVLENYSEYLSIETSVRWEAAAQVLLDSPEPEPRDPSGEVPCQDYSVAGRERPR